MTQYSDDLLSFLRRFSSLILEPNEIYFEDFLATMVSITTTSWTIQITDSL